MSYVGSAPATHVTYGGAYDPYAGATSAYSPTYGTTTYGQYSATPPYNAAYSQTVQYASSGQTLAAQYGTSASYGTVGGSSYGGSTTAPVQAYGGSTATPMPASSTTYGSVSPTLATTYGSVPQPPTSPFGGAGAGMVGQAYGSAYSSSPQYASTTQYTSPSPYGASLHDATAAQQYTTASQSPYASAASPYASVASPYAAASPYGTAGSASLQDPATSSASMVVYPSQQYASLTQGQGFPSAMDGPFKFYANPPGGFGAGSMGAGMGGMGGMASAGDMDPYGGQQPPGFGQQPQGFGQPGFGQPPTGFGQQPGHPSMQDMHEAELMQHPQHQQQGSGMPPQQEQGGHADGRRHDQDPRPTEASHGGHGGSKPQGKKSSKKAPLAAKKKTGRFGCC